MQAPSTGPILPSAQGSFAKTPFPHLLVYALEQRLSGTFELCLPGAEPTDGLATLLVIQGMPAKVRIAEPAHFLGEVMLELGLVSAEAVTSSLDRMAETGRLQGQILVELGATDEASLDAGVRAQLERKLEYLFTLPAETEFSYFDGVDNLQQVGGPPTPVDPLPALWRGIQQVPVWEHVDATLKRVGSAGVRIAANAELDRFQFRRVEGGALDLLRQRPMRVVDLAGAKVVGPSVAQLLIYVLVITKQVDLVEATSKPAGLPAASSSGRLPAPDGSPSSPELPPPSARAFARVQLQPKAAGRSPLVVSEEPVPRNATDERVASPLPFPSPAAPDHAALRAKILERAAQISSQNYFQMLGLEQDASAEVVQKTFFALAKVWHPDRLPSALLDLKDECSKVFTHLTEAHATLCDPDRREQYKTLLKDGGATPDDQALIQTILEAAMAFQKAEIVLSRNDTTLAYELAKKAHDMDPHQADYLAMVTWLEALRPECLPREKTLEKIAILDRCILKNANSERAYFWRGMLYKRIDEMARALKDFKKAGELNPRNLDAVREVRLHNLRGQSKPPPAGGRGSTRPGPPKPETLGGLFGKFFKK